MTPTKISWMMGLAFLLTQFYVCPVYAQDWFLPRTEQLLFVRHIEPKECADLLRTMVPDACIEVVESGLRVEATLGAMDQVRELLAELDTPLERVLLDVRFLVWDESCAGEIRRIGKWSEGAPSVSEIWPPCFGNSYNEFRFLESQGKLRWLSRQRTEARLGKSTGLELKADELALTLNLNVEVSLGARHHIETNIRIYQGTDGALEHRISRLLPDGSAVVIKGFADPSFPNLKESEEFVLVLVPYLTR